MVIERKPLYKMNQDAIAYLANNTEITYLNDGGIAVSLLKAANKEIANLQDLATTLFRNQRVSTASGVFLDMIGELFNLKRLTATSAATSRADANLRFYVDSGSLGTYLPHPTDRTKGLIPSNVRISNQEASVVYQTTEDTVFPRGQKAVYVSAQSIGKGSNQSIGAGKLVSHNLGVTEVKVVNETSISSGRDEEDDESFRFRISNAVLSLAGGNKSAIESSVLAFPGVKSLQIREFVRGTGTFDVFVVPTSQKLGSSLRNQIFTTIQRAKALGVDARVKEPIYVPFAISIQLYFYPNVESGRRQVIRDSVRTTIKDYLETIPLGGEIVINQIRSSVISTTTTEIKDMKILELCFKERPQIIRNIRLRNEELLILDENKTVPIEVI